MQANRLFSKFFHPCHSEHFTGIASSIALWSIAVGIFVMLISYAILNGFRQQISNKIFSFGGHIQLTKYEQNVGFQENGIPYNAAFVDTCMRHPYISSVSSFCQKAGIIKANNEICGAIVKGIDSTFDFHQFRHYLLDGTFINFKDSASAKSIVISSSIAHKLKLKTGDYLIMYFIQNPPRYRKLKIVGIYETGLEEFDQNMVFGHHKLIKKLNNWPDSTIGGYDISLHDISKIDSAFAYIYYQMDYGVGIEKITDKYISLFDWLKLLNQNVRIFLGLIMLVVVFNMVSCLFVIIMEKTSVIGILKALGAGNKLINQLFVNNILLIVLKGMAVGNILAILFCVLQYYFGIIPLDKENYYVDAVPVAYDIPIAILLNIALFALSLAALLVPNIIISRISPARAIRFA